MEVKKRLGCVVAKESGKGAGLSSLIGNKPTDSLKCITN